MTTTICVCNEKGGVLKTTLSIHLVYYLVNMLKKNVLLVDLDTQGSAGGWFMERDVDNEHVPASTAQFLEHGVPNQALAPPSSPGLSVLSGGGELANLDDIGLHTIVDALRGSLDDVEGFDYIVIDTPPERGRRLIAGIGSADLIIIPSDFTFFSQQGVNAVVETIGAVHRDRRIAAQPRVVGIVPTNIDGKDKKQIQAVSTELRGELGKLIIRKSVKARPTSRQVIDNHQTIWELGRGLGDAAKKDMSEAISALCTRIFKAEGEQS